MKKCKQLFLLFVTMLVTLIGTGVIASADDYSATYSKVNVNKVEDITDLLNVSGYGVNNGLSEITTTGTYTYYYSFTLNQASYVDLKTLTKATQYSFAGNCMIYLSTSKSFVNTPVIQTYLTNDEGNYKTALEAGTYYLKVTCCITSNYLVNDRYFNMAIYTQPLSRTGSTTGTTMAKPISLSSSSTGIFTKTSRTQWFKFKVTSKSNVSLSTILTTPLQWTEATATVKVYNSAGSAISENYNIYGGNSGNSCSISLSGLSAGTYYVCVWTTNTDRYCTIKQTASIKDVYAPSTPTITSYTSGNKYVSGKGEVGATAYVTYNGKTYSAKVNSSGVYKVTVPVLKVGKAVSVKLKDASGNASPAKKVTVKNRAITKPKVTTYKKNTKKVAGTAKAGTTVTVTYNGKSYKSTVKSNGKYSVSVAKLVKGKKVAVKITDSVGNYSSTVTVTVK